MSADNYLYVRLTEAGKFVLEDRSASCYYRDEGHTVESLIEDHDVDSGIDESWLCDPDRPFAQFDDVHAAMKAAFKEERENFYEYGMQVSPEVHEALSAPTSTHDHASEYQELFWAQQNQATTSTTSGSAAPQEAL